MLEGKGPLRQGQAGKGKLSYRKARSKWDGRKAEKETCFGWFLPINQYPEKYYPASCNGGCKYASPSLYKVHKVSNLTLCIGSFNRNV